MIEAEIWKEREHVHIAFSCGITFKTACTMDANLSNIHMVELAAWVMNHC